MAEPSRVDPDPAREAVVRTFRRRDEVELQTDLVTLIERRSDLAAVRSAELFRAAIVRLQERYDVKARVPSAGVIGVWVDAVVPPDPGTAIAPVAGAVPYPPDPNMISLLTEPASAVVARGLLALAVRRRDLSDLQRYELFLAGRLHLLSKGDFIVHPTRQGIFAWIDLVAPVRTGAGESPTHRHRDAPMGPSALHDGLAASSPLGADPTAVDPPADTERVPAVEEAGTTSGWHALTSGEATRRYVERGLSDDTIRQKLDPWLNHMTNAEHRDWEALLAELRRQGGGERLVGGEPADFRTAPDFEVHALPVSEALRDYLEANPPGPSDTYGGTRADRYRRPGWSDLAEVMTAQTQERRQAGHPKAGRPPGSGWLIKDRAELLDMYRQLRQRAGRRPSQGEFASAASMGTRTVRRYLQRFGLRWPPE